MSRIGGTRTCLACWWTKREGVTVILVWDGTPMTTGFFLEIFQRGGGRLIKRHTLDPYQCGITLEIHLMLALDYGYNIHIYAVYKLWRGGGRQPWRGGRFPPPWPYVEKTLDNVVRRLVGYVFCVLSKFFSRYGNCISWLHSKSFNLKSNGYEWCFSGPLPSQAHSPFLANSGCFNFHFY